jgi:hypothetical protein
LFKRYMNKAVTMIRRIGEFKELGNWDFQTRFVFFGSFVVKALVPYAVLAAALALSPTDGRHNRRSAICAEGREDLHRGGIADRQRHDRDAERRHRRRRRQRHRAG